MGMFRDSPGDISNRERSDYGLGGSSGGNNSAADERIRAARERAFNDSVMGQVNTDSNAMQAGDAARLFAGIGSSFIPGGNLIRDPLADAAERGARAAVQGGYGYGGDSQYSNRFGAPNQRNDDNQGGNMGMFNPNYGQGDNRSPGQIEMDRQDQFLQYAGGMYHPGMQRGEDASQALFDYYSGNPQAMQEQVNQSVMDSPFLAQNISLGEDAIARNSQATGGFRSGTTQENLAQNSQNVYQNLYNQQLQQNLQGLGGFSDQGANQLNQYSNFGRNMINDIGSTSGNIESQKIARDANDQNFMSGIIGGVASGLGSYFGS